MKLDAVWPFAAIGLAVVGIGIAIWKIDPPAVPPVRRNAPADGTELVVTQPFFATRELADVEFVASPVVHTDPESVEAMLASGAAVRLEIDDRLVLLELCDVARSIARRAKIRTAYGELWTDGFNVMTHQRTRPAH